MCVHRRRRVGIDQVHDDPEKELLKEVEVYQGILALLHRTRAQMEEQIRWIIFLHRAMFTGYYSCCTW